LVLIISQNVAAMGRLADGRDFQRASDKSVPQKLAKIQKVFWPYDRSDGTSYLASFIIEIINHLFSGTNNGTKHRTRESNVMSDHIERRTEGSLP